VGLRLVHIVQFDDVGVAEILEDLNLVLKHFKPRGRKLAHINDFDRHFLLVLSHALVDVTAVAGSDFVGFFVFVVPDVNLVLAEATAGLEEFRGGSALAESLVFGVAVVAFGGDNLVGGIVPLTHLIDNYIRRNNPYNF
jgi:hypothetical protein